MRACTLGCHTRTRDESVITMSLVFVTGAASGVGLLTARELIDDGHDVVIHARNPERLTGEVTEIVDKVRGVVYGDLDSVTGVETVAASANEYGAFDAVIHNAGSAGEQKTFAVNVVAPYVLSALMTRPKRIVTVSSVMHVNGSPEALPNAFATGVIDYSNSKLFVTALMMGLARHWPEIMVHSVHPGWVPTRMGGPSATDDLDLSYRTQTWLATAPESDIVPRTGGYWFHKQVQNPHSATLDPAFQDEVLHGLKEYTGVELPL